MRGAGVLLLTLVLTFPAAAEDPPAAPRAPEDPPAAPREPLPLPRLGRVRGERVNVRIGPRVGGRPVMQLNDGDLVEVVERLPGWFGVRIPRGFRAAVSDAHVRVLDPDTMMVEADRLTLRLDPPAAEGADPGAAFVDRAVRGDRFVRIEEAAPGWSWVVAPETTRVYVHAHYVDENPEDLADEDLHDAALEDARGRRVLWIEELAARRIETRRKRAESALRDALGTIQDGLYRARMDGGHDRAPIVELANRMDAALEAADLAPPPLRRVAEALRGDLDAELALRVALRDAAVARARGLDPGPDPARAESAEAVRLTGVLRFEPVPAWRTGGAWILWNGDVPTHVIRLTTGMPLPHPDLKRFEGVEHTYVGRRPGERLFGLPVVDLKSIE